MWQHSFIQLLEKHLKASLESCVLFLDIQYIQLHDLPAANGREVPRVLAERNNT